MKDGESDHPKIGHISAILTLWQEPSTRFETPKAIIYLQFACPEVSRGNARGERATLSAYASLPKSVSMPDSFYASFTSPCSLLVTARLHFYCAFRGSPIEGVGGARSLMQSLFALAGLCFARGRSPD